MRGRERERHIEREKEREGGERKRERHRERAKTRSVAKDVPPLTGRGELRCSILRCNAECEKEVTPSSVLCQSIHIPHHVSFEQL